MKDKLIANSDHRGPIGGIELCRNPHAPLMLGKPVIAFIWLYLLVRELTDPDFEISRGSFADELTPGLPVEKQLNRLRDRLDDMVHRESPRGTLLALQGHPEARGGLCT